MADVSLSVCACKCAHDGVFYDVSVHYCSVWLSHLESQCVCVCVCEPCSDIFAVKTHVLMSGASSF